MNKRGCSVLCVTALLIFSANLARAVDLTAVESDGVGSNPISMATGDFDKDGFTDIVVANWNSANVSVLLNKADGSAKFKSADSYGTGTNPHAVAVGDFNGDGYLDLAVANASDGTVSILLNQGLANPGHFKPKTDIPAGNSPYAIVVDDFDGNGTKDLVVVNQGQGISALLGVGNGTFGAPIFTSSAPVAVTSVNPTSVAVGDFYSATGKDLAITDLSGFVCLMKSLGTGHFAPAVAITTSGQTPRPFAVVSADLGTGKPDLVVADYGGNMYVLIGTGPGTFNAPVAYPAGSVPVSVAVGDFNGDGKNDIVVANAYSNNIMIFHGQGTGLGNGTFGTRQDIPTGVLPSFVVAADFKNAPPTSSADVAVAIYFSNVVTIMKNGQAGPIIVPPPPPTLFNSAVGSVCTGIGPTCSVNYTPATGSTLVVACVGWVPVTIASVTDNLGTPYINDGQQTVTIAGTTSFIARFHASNILTVGSRTITCTTASGNYAGIVTVAEYH